MLGNGKRCRLEENEPGSSNVVSQETNPLMNSVVLERLFDFCKLSDLFRYRLVSKEWYSSSLPRIRKEATVKIAYHSRFCIGPLHWNTFHENPQIVQQKFRGFLLTQFEFADAPPLPPSKFPDSMTNFFVFFQGPEEIELVYKNMEQFWVQCGHFIRRLELVEAQVYSVNAFKKALFEDTPKLEKLTLIDVVLRDGDGLRQDEDEGVGNVNLNLKNLKVICTKRSLRFPISWTLLFDNFPSIQTFELDNGIDLDDVINALLKKLESQKEIPLKGLKLSKRYKNQNQYTALQRLLELPNLKLTSVDLTGMFFEEERGRRVLQAALRCHGGTLESFFVSSSRHQLHSYYPSAPMNNFLCITENLQMLTHLNLIGAVCPSFHFLQQTPNLKILHIRGFVKLPETDFEIIGDAKLQFVKEFEFLPKCISEEAMKRFVHLLPNVESFAGFIDSGAFRVVCANWRKLTSLSTSLLFDRYGHELSDVDYIGDEAITGIVDGVEERLPNITDLQCLDKLTIYHTDKIGDSSIWNGFLKLPTLSELFVLFSPTTSDQALAALLERYPEQYCPRYEPLRASTRVKRPPKFYQSN